MGGGAWPFLVGGVICLVNSVNERDLSLLIKYNLSFVLPAFAEAVGVLLPCGAARHADVGDQREGFTDRILHVTSVLVTYAS